MPSRLQISDMAVSPSNPHGTIRIFFSAENWRCVAFLICLMTSFDFAIFQFPSWGKSHDYEIEIHNFKQFLTLRKLLAGLL